MFLISKSWVCIIGISRHMLSTLGCEQCWQGNLGPAYTSKANRGSALPQSGAGAGQEAEPDEQYTSLLAGLEEQRQQLAVHQQDFSGHFRVTLLGGPWQVERTNRAVYGVRADVRKGTATAEFRDSFSLSKSASFEQNIYGERVGGCLAQLWMHRLCHLAQCWEAHGRPATFPLGSLAPYEMPQECAAVLLGLTGRAVARMRRIIELAPDRSQV